MTLEKGKLSILARIATLKQEVEYLEDFFGILYPGDYRFKEEPEFITGTNTNGIVDKILSDNKKKKIEELAKKYKVDTDFIYNLIDILN